jgi:F0F1-type ATP synthase assembly protein I
VVDDEPKESPINAGFRWAYAITSCGLEIVLAAGAGYWVDSKLHTLPAFVIAGLLLGMTAATYHLYILLRDDKKSKPEE